MVSKHVSKLTWVVAVAAALAVGRTAIAPIKFGDYRNERPGVWHKITFADLPKPYATQSVDNAPRLVARPGNTIPLVKPGFKVTEYAGGLEGPRLVRCAPNGDLFVAESEAGRIKVIRA